MHVGVLNIITNIIASYLHEVMHSTNKCDSYFNAGWNSLTLLQIIAKSSLYFKEKTLKLFKMKIAKK